MQVELNDFLLTGRLGPLCYGMKRHDVVEHFGEPFHRRDYVDGHGTIVEERFFYDALSISFEGLDLAHYGLWFDLDQTMPAILNARGPFPVGGNVPMKEFLRYLEDSNIPYRERTEDVDILYKYFTKGDVAIGGKDLVYSLSVVCPGTKCWHKIMEFSRGIKPGAGKPFPKR